MRWFPDLGEGSSDGQTEELVKDLKGKVMELVEKTTNLLEKSKSALDEGTEKLSKLKPAA